MKIRDLNPPILELPLHQPWFRTQRRVPRHDSVRHNGLLLAPPGIPVGRFDLLDQACAYLADSPLTSLYESVFRRELLHCTLSRLRERALASFQFVDRPRVLDLREFAPVLPVLHSVRYQVTQSLAAQAVANGLDGVLYSSAQHPSHACLCLFETGIDKVRRIAMAPLVHGKSDVLLADVVHAQYGSQVPIVPD